jgi:hypothetical protein
MSQAPLNPGSSSPDDPPLAERYKEICQNIRETDETSFKLLATVPIAAGIGSGALAVLEKSTLLEQGYAGFAVLGLSVFGALITFGLFQWELRNVQKCKWLISRAAKLEQQMAAGHTLTQQFDGMASPDELAASRLQDIRLPSLMKLPWGKTQAEQLIYCAAVGIWFVPMGIGLYQMTQPTNNPSVAPPTPGQKAKDSNGQPTGAHGDNVSGIGSTTVRLMATPSSVLNHPTSGPAILPARKPHSWKNRWAATFVSRRTTTTNSRSRLRPSRSAIAINLVPTRCRR